MNIEKALRNYLNGTGPKVKEKDIFKYYNGNGNAVFNVFFKLTDEVLDSMNEKKILDRLVEMLKLGSSLLRNDDNLDRKAITKKIFKLQQKLERIIAEGQHKFKNIKRIQSEFNKVNRQLEELLELSTENNTKQYDFMSFLVEKTKDIGYLEFTLKKIPTLANVKDKDEVSLFRCILQKYLESLQSSAKEDAMYYDNLITLLLSQSSFQLTEKERRECLDLIFKYLNQMCCNKRSVRKYSEQISVINKLVERLKGSFDSKRDIEEIASKYHIHTQFPDSIQTEAKLSRINKEGQMTDREVIEDFTISMDREDTIEIDDAFSCERLRNGNYLYKIHIASVLGYFPYHSEIVQEAIYRCRSIGLPKTMCTEQDAFHRIIPIFPYEFAANMGSLKEEEKRLARSYIFEITPDGKIVDERFVKSIIKNNKQLTFSEANKIIQTGCSNPVLEETMNCLLKVTDIIARQFKSATLYDLVKENTTDNSNLRVKKEGAERIVYYAMFLVGNRVANFFARNNYPFSYLVHEVNEDNNRKLQAMIDNLKQTYGEEQFSKLCQLIEGVYPRSYYAMEGKHTGLGVDHHCRCTSELRRGQDILVEHALEVCYDKTPTEKELEELRKEIASKIVEINARQTSIDYFVKDCQKKYRRR